MVPQHSVGIAHLDPTPVAGEPSCLIPTVLCHEIEWLIIDASTMTDDGWLPCCVAYSKDVLGNN